MAGILTPCAYAIGIAARDAIDTIGPVHREIGRPAIIFLGEAGLPPKPANMTGMHETKMTTPAEWHARGLALLANGETLEARNMFALALNAEGGNVRYILDYAQAYIELGRFEKARDLLRAAQALEPNSFFAHFRMANLYKQHGYPKKALPFYNRAIEIDPSFARAYNNRGASYHIMGIGGNARADYLKALALDPAMTEAYLNLGRLMEAEDEVDAAAALYRQALEQGLDRDLFTHLLASVTGAVTAKAPIGYVRAIFADYANSFDLHYVNNLKYSLPPRVGALVRDHAIEQGRNLTVIDLGCGTGLCGIELRGITEHLAGVDASAAMLDLADRRGLYHDLVEGDIESYLPIVPAVSVDALIAADVLIYVGELGSLFAEAERVLRTGGLFVVSVETLAGAGDYKLQRSGRFAHAPDYVQTMAHRYGMAIASAAPVDLRMELGTPVPGVLFALRKTSG
jgi:predicted TPR repeat methyltransferase